VIADLAEQPDSHRVMKTDVLIVGAGIAGLILANRLRQKKLHVVVLESGNREQKSEFHPLNRVVQLGDPYSGADRGRFRCLGGTSTRWGGALIPFLEHDLDGRPYLGLPPFPAGAKAVDGYITEVEKLFGLDTGSFEEQFVNEIGAIKQIPIGDPDFKTRFAKWPAFQKRNLAVLFRDRIQRDPDLEVWINSNAAHFEIDAAGGRITSITGRSQGNKSITVTAKHVVICAGAIESTRLLLLLNRQYNGRIFHHCNVLGRYFYDHISAPMASINTRHPEKLNRMAGFRFVGSTMRSLRFELSPGVQEREQVGSAFGHISFRNETTTGFDIVRELFRTLQRRGRISPALLISALHEAPFLLKMAYWRAMYNQLLWPIPAQYELHVVAEQQPRADNYIALSSETDLFGLPLAAINWRVSKEDCSTFSVFRRCFDEFWRRRGLEDIGELAWIDEADSNLIDRMSGADVYHPGGSTRMGIDQESAVVNSDLRLFGLANLWVASTSVFPSGGGANPTLTLMLFAMRLADHLSSGALNAI
jgi:choline dehydrogenase-like flavoprotein